MNPFRTVLGALLLLVLCAVILPGVGGFQWLTVISGSMEPAIGTGSAVLIHPCPVDRLQTGDIITCRFGKGKLKVTHRLMRIEPGTGQIITKGDANEQEDPPADPACVLGKVWLAVPHLGYFFLFLRSVQGKLVCTGVLVVCAFFGEHRRHRPGKEQQT